MEEISFRIYEMDNKKRSRIYPFIMSGDGLLVTSMVGSTAYNKSAGGPIILTPNVFCITFLNADGPYNNPLVLDSGKEVEIEIVKYEGMLALDNKKIAKVKRGDRFRIRLSNKVIRVVRLNGVREKFADKLERKIRSKLIKELK